MQMDGGAVVRKGPWTMEEDRVLANYFAANGEGTTWDSIPGAADLKRTGKSCRLRWLNYLRPDVRRGNITAGEHMLIVELQLRWGNRWAKISKHLPGRSDNEIKNFWRTKIQKKRGSNGEGTGSNFVGASARQQVSRGDGLQLGYAGYKEVEEEVATGACAGRV